MYKQLLLLAFILVAFACDNPFSSKERPEPEPIVFTTKSGDYTQIHAIHEDGGGITQLTNSPFHNSEPRWSKDGEWIIFNSRARTSNHHFDTVVIADKHGRNEQVILEHGFRPMFSPDGKRIAFAYDTELPGWGGKYDIVIYDLESGSATLVLPDSKNYFVSDWSSDGRYLLATCFESPVSPQSMAICLIDLQDSTKIELLAEKNISPGRFSLDGQSITYARQEQPTHLTFRETLHTMQVDGTNKRNVATLENTFIGASAWSPDGAQIAFVAWNTLAKKDKENIYMVNSDGSGLRVLFTHQVAYSISSLDWRW